MSQIPLSRSLLVLLMVLSAVLPSLLAQSTSAATGTRASSAAATSPPPATSAAASLSPAATTRATTTGGGPAPATTTRASSNNGGSNDGFNVPPALGSLSFNAGPTSPSPGIRSTSSANSNTNTSSSNGPNVGMIAGIAVGAIAFLVVAGMVGRYLTSAIRRSNEKKRVLELNMANSAESEKEARYNSLARKKAEANRPPPPPSQFGAGPSAYQSPVVYQQAMPPQQQGYIQMGAPGGGYGGAPAGGYGGAQASPYGYTTQYPPQPQPPGMGYAQGQQIFQQQQQYQQGGYHTRY
ncbi:hypothetical protein BJ742DRAFT_830779 [Cladochytrium replicatum]|nr:hypothetical protein BJ742DRAFT_830779 [Cladochytrium replicatum]